MATAKDAPTLAPGRAGDPRNTSFIPRNFLIEERIDTIRAAHYAAAIPSGGPSLLDEWFDEWNAAHNAYLAGNVFCTPPASHDYQAVATDDPAVCPETFRSTLALTAFRGTDLDTHFIRVVPVADLERMSDRLKTADEIYALGMNVVQDPRPQNPAWSDLGMILEEAYFGRNCDHRPVFAAFYEDFMEALRDPADTTWADRLRDRLGLYHLNQWAGPFPRRVFLFRYAVRELPRKQGDPDRRPIALPTVLDHRFSEAFCPAPRELPQGQVVNLQANAADESAREVLHLFMPLEPKHLFRVGTVTTPVPDYLGPARRDHLLWLRLLSDREDYAAATDNDLF